MEFKRTQVQANIYGEVFTLRRPSFDERESFSEAMAEAMKADDTKAIIKLQREFVVKMGVPDKVLRSMEAEHVDALAIELIGKKKG